MWTCGNCREVLEDQFDACWNCGSSRDGKLNLDFATEGGKSAEASALKAELAKSFVCQRCKRCEAHMDVISTRGIGLGALLRKDFLVVSCTNCGWTEFYSLNVLEGRTDLGNLFRSIFGT
ncbi:MAG TPA: zinc ribbon domain-containing protein [Pirellulaceae bacterium]|nr:zinc ribbon domain-containing protein [Pirellulaceae bacterium]